MVETTPVNDWSEVPDFANEDDEHEFWRTHSFGDALLDQMERTPRDPDLPPVIPSSNETATPGTDS